MTGIGDGDIEQLGDLLDADGLEPGGNAGLLAQRRNPFEKAFAQRLFIESADARGLTPAEHESFSLDQFFLLHFLIYSHKHHHKLYLE